VLAAHDVPRPAAFGAAIGQSEEAEVGWTGSAGSG
jgi:hypothetical protein